MSRPKYSLEIDCGGRQYETDGMWACYGTIIADGDTLEQCLMDASVDIMDQDGGELRFSPLPADEEWMQKLITEAFYKKAAK